MSLDFKPIDFKLLSMSELRQRPGEVLDRVADNGEAFIVERNGNRKACLVPLSLFLPDINPTRIADELTILAQQQEIHRPTINADRELSFLFKYEIKNHAPIDITIVLPHGYPNICPRIYATPLKEGAPHRWANGMLCIFGVMSGWNPGKHTVYSTLNLARRWLEQYDIWRLSGTWPRTGFSDD